MPKIVDHDLRRAELLEASLGLVAEEGIEAATMRRLARAAQCTTGAVTYYFEGRDALLVAMLRHAHQRAGARMVKAASSSSDPRARLRSVVREALPLDRERLLEWRVWLAFWGAAAGNPALGEEHAGRYDEWRALLEALAREALGDGDVTRFVETLIAIVDGYGVQIALCRGLKSGRARGLIQALDGSLENHFAQFGVESTLSSPPSRTVA